MPNGIAALDKLSTWKQNYYLPKTKNENERQFYL